MLTLARNRAMAECILLSGDEDVRIGVQQAQEYGVRVHLVGIAHARPSQSEFLKQEADSTHEWTKSDLEAFLVCNCEPAFDHEPMNTEISAEDAEILREIAQHHASQLSDKKKSEVLQLTAGEDWPRNIHRALLGHAKNKFGKFLERGEQTFLKTEFRKQLENSTE